MNKQAPAAGNDMGTLAKDARVLISATTGVAGEKTSQARKRLTTLLESGRQTLGRIQERGVEGLKGADKAVRDHPHQAIGISLGLGAIIGCLVARRRSRDEDGSRRRAFIGGDHAVPKD